MALPYRVARGIVGVIEESTPYTFLEPTAAKSFHARNITIKPSQTPFERNVTRSHFGILDNVMGSAEMEISFEMDMIGGETAGVPALGIEPIWGTAIAACGHQRITVAATSITYKPSTLFDGSGTTTKMPSEVYSVAVWEESGSGTVNRYALKGGQGMVTIETAQGSPGVLKFTFKGAYQATIADSIAASVTDPLINPPAFLGATLSVHAVSTLAFDGFSFDKGNVLSKRAASSDANGIKGYWITAHKPTIKITPEMVPVATLDMFGLWKAGTAGAFSAVWGTAGGNRFTFTASRTQINDLSIGEREGARSADIGLLVTTTGTAVDGADYSILID